MRKSKKEEGKRKKEKGRRKREEVRKRRDGGKSASRKIEGICA